MSVGQIHKLVKVGVKLKGMRNFDLWVVMVVVVVVMAVAHMVDEVEVEVGGNMVEEMEAVNLVAEVKRKLVVGAARGWY